MDKPKSTEWKDEEKTAYILLGWPDESMKKRVETIAKQITEDLNNNLNKKVIITGYKFEIEKIKNYLKEALTEEKYNQIELKEVLSYDTFTNISKIKKKTDIFDKHSKFIISTSESHGRRVKMIFEKLFTKSDSHENEFYNNSENHNKFSLELINSWETEVNYARLAENIYRNVNPKMLQYASIALRPKDFIIWYLIPLMKEKDMHASIKKYVLSFLTWYRNQAST